MRLNLLYIEVSGIWYESTNCSNRSESSIAPTHARFGHVQTKILIIFRNDTQPRRGNRCFRIYVVLYRDFNPQIKKVRKCELKNWLKCWEIWFVDFRAFLQPKSLRFFGIWGISKFSNISSVFLIHEFSSKFSFMGKNGYSDFP